MRRLLFALVLLAGINAFADDCGCEEVKVSTFTTIPAQPAVNENSGINKLRKSKGLPPLPSDKKSAKPERTEQSGTYIIYPDNGGPYYANDLTILYCRGYVVMQFSDAKNGKSVTLIGVSFRLELGESMKPPMEKAE